MKETKDKFFLSIKKYSAQEQDRILDCYKISEARHSGQMRKTGHDFFLHPLSVALNISLRDFDHSIVCAALLHDLIEDTATTHQELASLFGAEIADLVEGVSKLSAVPIRNKKLFFSSENYYAERIDNYRKLLVSSASDIRVLVIKLFDRLHNMESIEVMQGDKKRYYSLETIEIYAQIAERVGFGELKRSLEDISFPHAYPEDYQRFQDVLRSLPNIDKNFIDIKKKEIETLLNSAGISDFSIQTRVKHNFSIYKKIKDSYNFNLDKFYDLYGARIIAASVEDCYKALGLVHGHYKPDPDRIYDMISGPKNNGYQSLHTTLTDGSGKIFELQIRTKDMHQVAEFGPAAHWHYKSAGDNKVITSKSQKEWLDEIKNICDIGSSKELLEGIKNDPFSKKIFVFTPKGDIFSILKGASVIDFAFRIHSKLGERCSGAKVNGAIVGLSTEIQNGDTVEILTSARARPNINWLRNCKTNEARQKIKHYLTELDRDRLLQEGKRIFLEIREELDLPQLSDKTADKLVSDSRLPYNRLNDLLVALSNRIVSRHAVAKLLYPDSSIIKPKRQRRLVKEADKEILAGIRYSLAKCCNPNSNQKIVGYVGRDHVIKVHKKNCKLIKNADPNRLIFIDPFDSQAPIG